MRTSTLVSAFALLATGLAFGSADVRADQRDDFDGHKRADFERMMESAPVRARAMAAKSAQATKAADGRCVDGIAADEYACNGVDLLSFISIADLNVSFVNDIWGWSDRKSGREYALLGSTEGTTFIDVTFPATPRIIGFLPTAQVDEDNPFWRDIKVYRNHAFIVSEERGSGMQVFDLRQLRGLGGTQIPKTFESTAQYDGFESAHNININTRSGHAYVVGADTCLGGLEMIDIKRPRRPKSAGCFSDHGYVHDTQCVRYRGPDREHRGREICFNSSSNSGDGDRVFLRTLSIVDVTDKANPVGLANVVYGGMNGMGYSHQGWLTPSQRYFLHNDELDEFFGSVDTTTTRVWDVTDLDQPKVIGGSTNGNTSIDHNMYTRGRFTYASNYTSGLRIFDSSSVRKAELPEVAFFDMYPENDDATFEGGTWSNYPYFSRRGMVAVSSMDRGFYLLDVLAAKRRTHIRYPWPFLRSPD